MPFFVLFLVILTFSPCLSQTLHESADQVWEVGDRRWTVEEERRFEKWMDETMTEDFFVRHRIPTDCADAVYAIRWIYARIAHLPAAATTLDGQWVGHWSTGWKDLPTHPEWHKDARFRAALLSLFPKIWTGTLPLDTYPIRISPDSVTPGTLFLDTGYHTGIIARVSRDGAQAHPLLTWESQPPVKVQKLRLRYFFTPKPEFNTRSGLVKFRWPVSKNGGWGYLPVEDHPFYSEEQYVSDFCEGNGDFVEAVARRMDPTDYAPVDKLLKVLGTITGLLEERVPIVLAGYQRCGDGGCPEGSELWELHNTAGRDGMLISLMDHLSQIITLNHLDPETSREMMEAISIDISENRSSTLHQVYRNHLWLSSHPENSIEARWGLKKCETIYERMHIANDSIEFIKKTYLKKNPDYADFAIRQQQHILRKLYEEWTGAECRTAHLRLEKRPPTSPPLIEALPELNECGTIRAEIRAINDSIAYVKGTYQRNDPDYAAFAIGQQQLFLEKLSEKWVRSDCREQAPESGKKARLSRPSIETHSGPQKCSTIRAEIRATNDSIAFIEGTYRGNDPEYADFAIRQQQLMMQKLNEEWVRSECK